MLKKLLNIICLLSFVAGADAQLSFDKSEVDMGQLLWYVDGRTVVNVTNTGSRPVRISKIETSSTRLKATCAVSQLPAGGSAELSLDMDASLLGSFRNAVLVYTTDAEKPYRLLVQGSVNRELDNYKGNYPYHVGDIWLSTDNIEFDDAQVGEFPRQTIEVKNTSQKVYRPELMHLPSYLSAVAEPEQVMPGRTGRLVVTLDAKKVEGFGLKQTSVYLSRFPGDKVCPETEIAVSAVILPPFDTTSVVQAALAPHLSCSSEVLELPAFDGKSKVKGTIYLKNEGKSSLQIRSLQVFNPAVNVDLSRNKIAPGSVEKLKISVLAKYMKRSRNRLRVLMVTNDPQKPKVIFTVLLGKKTTAQSSNH